MSIWRVLFPDNLELASGLAAAGELGHVAAVCSVAARRRAALAVAAQALQTGGQGPQGKKLKHQPFSWGDHVRRMDEVQFKRRYRLSWTSFNELLHMIDGDLSVSDEKQAKCSHQGVVVPNAVKLAIGLRYLAGGDPLDLYLIYHVHLSYVYKCVWAVVDAVNLHIKIEFPIDDPEKLAVLEAGFRRNSIGGIWAGQVGALDGVHFAMIAPGNDDVNDPMRYHVARKDEYALLGMALCDYERRFTFYDISQVPTTHDSLAWTMTSLGQRIENGDLPEPYFINGDNAFSLNQSLICPSGLPEHDDFDFHQSSNRMPIECAFGILVQRWGILWRPLRCRFDRRAPLIGACMRLHNFCIDARVAEETVFRGGLGMVQPGRWEISPEFDDDDRPVHHLDIEQDQVPRPRDRRRLQQRNHRLLELVKVVKESGIVRPPLRAGKFKKVRGRKGRRKST